MRLRFSVPPAVGWLTCTACCDLCDPMATHTNKYTARMWPTMAELCRCLSYINTRAIENNHLSVGKYGLHIFYGHSANIDSLAGSLTPEPDAKCGFAIEPDARMRRMRRRRHRETHSNQKIIPLEFAMVSISMHKHAITNVRIIRT